MTYIELLLFRLVFPTIQQNTSILAVLPSWLETLGRKIDSAESEKAGCPFLHVESCLTNILL